MGKCIFTGTDTDYTIKLFGQELTCVPEIAQLIHEVRTSKTAQDKTRAYNKIMKSETQVLDENSDIVYKINNWLYQEVQKQMQIDENILQEESFDSLDKHASQDNDNKKYEKDKEPLTALRVITYVTIAVSFIFGIIFSSLFTREGITASWLILLSSVVNWLTFVIMVVCLIVVCVKKLQKELQDVFAMNIYYICAQLLSFTIPYIIGAIRY